MSVPAGVVLAAEDPYETFTPLGLQLWDLLRDQPVSGLRVEARRRHGTRRIAAFVTPSVVYAFRNLGGMHDTEFDPPDDVLAQAAMLSAPTEYFVSVTDPSGHFLPAVLGVPTPHAGLVTWPDVVPTSAPSATPIYLFSDPARPLPPGTAAIRARLAASDGSPLPYALVRVTVGALSFAGMADERGEVIVAFGYPEFGGAIAGSPMPGTSGTPMNSQAWTVRVTVFADRRGDLDIIEALPSVEREWPTTASVFAQPPRAIRPSVGDPHVPFLDRQLEFGRELQLHTANQPDALLLVDIAP